MTSAVRGLGLAASLMLVSTAAVVPQASAQSPAAHVYVQIQGPAGAVYGYSASSSGQLTAIPGSPFKPGTQIVGSNGSQFFTLGHTLLHSWAVGSNGAIGSQLSDASILNYAGGSCGAAQNGYDRAVLDHTGKLVYVLVEYNADWSCSAYQTYQVNSDGSFTFVGDTEENFGDQSDNPDPGAVDAPSILGNETFAYADLTDGHNAGAIGFKRESSGELQLMQFTETDPPLANGSYTVETPDASPVGDYVVFQLFPYDSTPPQLGVYTVDSSGNLSTTNTSSNMPTPSLAISSTSFSPDGSLFAVAGDGGSSQPSRSGVEIYNFNGANPLTPNTTLLNGTPIDQVAWDSSGHMYAMSKSESKLWVYSVTSKSVAEDSVVSVTSPFSMVVTSLAATTGGGGGACTAPSSAGVNVCSPSNGATVTSPVQINAAATVSGGVYRFELWNGSTKLLSEDNGTMDQSLSLAPGSYHLTFDARNSSGTHEYATRDITVQ